MDTDRNLLFGVVAFQNGAVDADGLAETYAAWASEPTQTLADLMVDRGLMTDEQRTEVEKVVALEMATCGGDPEATLAATMDGRSLEALGEVAGAGGVMEGKLAPAQVQGGHVVLGTLLPGETENRERYTLTHLHAKGGMGRVWLARDGSLGRQIALKELRRTSRTTQSSAPGSSTRPRSPRSSSTPGSCRSMSWAKGIHLITPCGS